MGIKNLFLNIKSGLLSHAAAFVEKNGFYTLKGTADWLAVTLTCKLFKCKMDNQMFEVDSNYVGDMIDESLNNLKQYLQTIGGLAYKSKSNDIIDILNEMEVKIDNISDKLYQQIQEKQ